MPELGLNLIAGEWVSGDGEIENRNPSDITDLVGRVAQASPDQLTTDLGPSCTGAGPMGTIRARAPAGGADGHRATS